MCFFYLNIIAFTSGDYVLCITLFNGGNLNLFNPGTVLFSGLSLAKLLISRIVKWWAEPTLWSAVY